MPFTIDQVVDSLHYREDPALVNTQPDVGRAIDPIRYVYKPNGTPLVYFAQLEDDSEKAAAQLHRSVWSQSLARLLVIVSPTCVRFVSAVQEPADRAGELGDAVLHVANTRPRPQRLAA